MQTINEKQAVILKQVIDAVKVPISDFHAATIRALEKRGFVKMTENKKGTFVSVTAKGKKALC